MKLKKRLMEAGILIVVFILAVIIFSYFTNKGNDNMTADMGTATFPQISFSCEGYTVNSVPGYAKEMEITAVRDTITPVKKQALKLDIKAYENTVKSLDYHVFTLDGKEELLDESIKKPGETATLKLEGDDLLAEERVLQIVLHLEGDKSVYFYTRITDDSGKNVQECLDYIRNFHENALKKAEGVGIGKAIEPNEEGDNTTFHHVTIHSDYNHVTWGGLEPEVEGEERWSIKEMNVSSASVLLEYTVRCNGEENEEDAYKVKEFFRVRYISGSGQTYLLDYDRTMDQMFDPTKKILSEKGILLGIADYPIPYLVNKDGTVVSFVQADELWSYNKNTNEVSLVFSFASAENTDARNFTSRHQVKLLNTDDVGNVTFAVYGYMNRGVHEGEAGVAVYYYDIEKSAVNEEVFISTDESYGAAIYELGKLVYYNVEDHILYTMASGTLYKIHVEKEKKEVLAEGLEEDQYVVSDDGHMVAYQTQKKDEAAEIQVINLSSEKERTVNCKEGEIVQPLGFMGNDFVYGVAKTEDAGQSVSGETVIPMYKVEIQNRISKVIKTYEADNIYVLSAEFSENMITLKRASKSGETFTGITDDYITNNEKRDESNTYLETFTTDLKETQMRVRYRDGISDQEPKILKPKQVLLEKPATVSFASTEGKQKYYVYGHGELKGIYDKAGDAVTKANPYNGVVVSEKQEYIWETGNRDLQYSISGMDEQVENMRTQLHGGTAPMEVMKNVMDRQGLDLTGCVVKDLLYMINQDRPVIGMLDAIKAVILVGYGETTVTYIDAESGERHSVSFEEMDQMTQGSGHTYVG